MPSKEFSLLIQNSRLNIISYGLKREGDANFLTFLFALKVVCHSLGHSRLDHSLITALICQVPSVNQAASHFLSQYLYLQPLAFSQCSLIEPCVGSQSKSSTYEGHQILLFTGPPRWIRKAWTSCVMTAYENYVALRKLVADEHSP